MSTATKLQRLIDAKASIKTAIEGKGVTVEDELKIDGYAAKIDLISQGTPGPTPKPYVRPADWIDISEVADNEINLLVTEATGCAFLIDVASGGTYSVEWGDGVTDTGLTSGSTAMHQHTTGGTWCSEGYYTWKVRIYATDVITRFQARRHTFTSPLQTSPILWVNFGTTGITDYSNTFYPGVYPYFYCDLLQEVQISSFAVCTSTSYMFQSCHALQSVTLPADTFGNVSYVNGMFYDCWALTSITLPTSWGNVIDTTEMFFRCYALQSITLPASWGNVTNTTDMFAVCYVLTSLTLPSSWGSITDATEMFYDCYGLTSITLPTSWGSVTGCAYMFQYCYVLQSITLPTSWGNVINCSYMFEECSALTSITLPDSWGSVIDTRYMFGYCYALTSIYLPDSWGNVQNTSGMFYYCSALKTITLPADTWGSVQNTSGMFGYCRNLSSIILPASWGDVTNTGYMFNNCWSLSSITLATSWGDITGCANMFDRCFSLKEVINVEYLGTTGETQCDMTNTFKDCAFLQGMLTIGSNLTKIEIYSSDSLIIKLTGLRLTNNASTFTGSSPQINVSFTNMGQSALVDLFNDLPSLSGKYINIMGCPGATLLTAGERAIATNKGWAITG